MSSLSPLPHVGLVADADFEMGLVRSLRENTALSGIPALCFQSLLINGKGAFILPPSFPSSSPVTDDLFHGTGAQICPSAETLAAFSPPGVNRTAQGCLPPSTFAGPTSNLSFVESITWTDCTNTTSELSRTIVDGDDEYAALFFVNAGADWDLTGAYWSWISHFV